MEPRLYTQTNMQITSNRIEKKLETNPLMESPTMTRLRGEIVPNQKVLTKNQDMEKRKERTG